MATTLIDVNRLKGILLQPGATWKAIDGEFTKPGSIYKNWVLPLALIGPICGAIGTLVFGMSFGVVGFYRLPIMNIVTILAVDYVLGVVGVWVLTLVISLLAPTFGGQRNDVQGLKVAAYATTAWFVAGVFQLLPQLALVRVLVSLYSVYLVFSGVPIVMKPSKDQAMGYAIVAVLGAIVVALLVLAIHTAFAPDYGTLRARV
jgi:Yip1-like protein